MKVGFFVENMNQLIKTPRQTYPLHLERDVAVTSTPTEEKSYKVEDALDVALIVIDSLCREMYSQDSLLLAFYAAQSRKPEHINEDDYNELILRVAERAEKLRKSNPISTLF